MKRASGFSLIELLVAMTVTLIIVAATLSLFESALHTNDTTQQLTNMESNLRSGLNLITRDLLQAGQGIPTGGVPIPSGAGCNNVNRPAPAATGTQSFPYGCPVGSNSNLPALIPGNQMGITVPSPAAGGGNLGNPNLTWVPSANAKSDIMTMMYQDNDLVTNIVAATLSTNPLVSLSSTSMTFSPAVAVSGAGVSNGVNVGDIFLISGPNPGSGGGTLNRYVVVTSYTGQTVKFNAGDVFNLNQQGVAASGTVNDFNPNPPGTTFPASCTYGSPWPPNPLPSGCVYTAQRVLMVSYWLDMSAPINGQAIPRLMRQLGMPPSLASCNGSPPPAGCPRPVAEVIESLELSYDYVNGTVPVNNEPSTALAAAACSCSLTDSQIRKVNIYLAGRSDALLAQTGQYLRTNMATQVDVRSLAFVNRYH